MRNAVAVTALLAGACSSGPTTGEQGAVVVTLNTTGLGTRPASFQVTVDASQSVQIAPSGTTTIGGLSAGVHAIQLTGIPLNCTPDWYTPQQATVVGKATTTIAFNISCDVPLTGSVVFTRRIGLRSAIFSMRSDGSQLRQLTDGTTNDDRAAVAPGGTRIAFIRGNGDLWVMNADGSGAARISTTRNDVASPDWSPDGTQLVFTSAKSLVIMAADGRAERVVWAMPPNDGSLPVEDPRWSPDGTRLVYSYGKEVDVIDLKTAVVKNVRPPRDGTWGIHPAWSPDGNRIAYIVGTRFAIINADGTGDVVVRDMGVSGSAGIAWSRGGGRLLVAISPTSEGIADVCSMNADGSELINLTNTPTVQEFFPAWASP